MKEPCFSEVYRYLGYRKEEPDAAIIEAVERCMEELQTLIRPRHTTCRLPLTECGKDVISFAHLTIPSKALSKNLNNCSEVVLFAATLGSEADHLISRSELVRITDAVICQAACAERIEAYCDEINETIRIEAEREGFSCRPRFSPGYGDFPLSYQKEILELLHAQQRIGLVLTEGDLMLPTKSVTALIGLLPDAGRQGENV